MRMARRSVPPSHGVSNVVCNVVYNEVSTVVGNVVGNAASYMVSTSRVRLTLSTLLVGRDPAGMRMASEVCPDE